jgi:hypothetical protein
MRIPFIYQNGEHMLNIETLKENPFLIESVRQNLSVAKDDESKDRQIEQLTLELCFERFLTWNGVIDYGPKLLRVFHAFRDSEVNGKISHEKLAELDNQDGIIESLRKRGQFPDFDDASFNDKNFDDYINSLTADNGFKEYATWNGLIFGLPILILIAINTLEKARC